MTHHAGKHTGAPPAAQRTDPPKIRPCTTSPMQTPLRACACAEVKAEMRKLEEELEKADKLVTKYTGEARE